MRTACTDIGKTTWLLSNVNVFFSFACRLNYPSVDNETEVIFHQTAGCNSYGIAVDSINDYLYWSNCSDIVRSNLDGSEMKTILDFSANGSVGALEVDSESG